MLLNVLKDAIVEFGTLKSDNFSSLKSFAAIVESSVNQNIRVRVIRDGAVKTLLLKPKTWSGERVFAFKLTRTLSFNSAILIPTPCCCCNKIGV